MAVCTLGNVRAEWAVGFASAQQPAGRVLHLALVKNMSVADARNYALNTACAMDAEYLMFWDDDIIPRQSDAPKLLITALDQHPEIDVIGGVYPMRRDVPEPVVVEREGGGYSWCWRDGKVHPVYMVGTGFMAIRIASIKQAAPNPYDHPGVDVPIGEYFRTEDFGDLGQTTDDYWFAEFCKHWKLKQYVHGGVIADQIQDYGEIMRVEDAEAVMA